MNADNWNRIFNYYWEDSPIIGDRTFVKQILTLCLSPSIDLICRDKVAMHLVIRHIESIGGRFDSGELVNICEECVDLEKSFEMFLQLVENVGYFKPKLSIDGFDWKTNDSFDDYPESDWNRDDIQAVLDKYLELNNRHPSLDRLLLKAFADFEVCWTMRDLTYQHRGRSNLEQEELDRNPKGLRALAVHEIILGILLVYGSFGSVVYFALVDNGWGPGVVISLAVFLGASNAYSLSRTDQLLKIVVRLMLDNPNQAKFESSHRIFYAEKKLYEMAYYPGFISVERLYASFEEAAIGGVAVDQRMWALLSDIKSRETILPNF